MSTSAERSVELTIHQRRYSDPDVVALVELVQAEYVVRYGGPDETPVDPAQFDPPTGVFVVGLLGSTPVACGGWRAYGEGTVKLKRMFVVGSARRRGYAARILAELEQVAAAAGNAGVVLETGTAQPEGHRHVSEGGLHADRALRPLPMRPAVGAPGQNSRPTPDGMTGVRGPTPDDRSRL